MKKAAAIAVALLLVAGGFLSGAWVQHHRARSGASAGRQVLYYVDPMHPAYRSDRPGTAPDCGMALEPVYSSGGAAPGASGEAAGSQAPEAAGTVHIAADKQQLLGVQVAPVQRAASAHLLRLLGRVVPEETRVYVLNAALEGAIRELAPVTTGSSVKKGQWLGSFFAADTRAPLQAFITALDVEVQSEAARRSAGVVVAAGSTGSKNSEFAVERLLAMGMTAGQVEEMRRSRSIPLAIDIRAPADGFVTARNVSVGQKFDKGAEWYRIANLDRVWILADLAESDAALLRPGMRAEVRLPRQQRAMPARVSAVPPVFDAATRTLKVRLEVENPGAFLRPEMFVDVELRVELPEAITIPVDALVDAGLRRTVFVERSPGHLEPRAVETGWRFGDRVEVVSGLAAGERIVTSGTFLVDSESRMRAAASGIHGAAARDPVCGMEVDEARARAAGRTHAHQGTSYTFCSEQCLRTFQSDPDGYAARAPARRSSL